MARKLRLEYAGAIYHVMNRGDRREPIFLSNLDRESFLNTLAAACEYRTPLANGNVENRPLSDPFPTPFPPP